MDGYGYPKNGHIICADTAWWTSQFERAGFQREIEIELALHQKYDEAMAKISRARRSFYVFSKSADPNKKSAVLRKLQVQG